MNSGNPSNGNGNGERFTGHGSEWRDANLKPEEAKIATAWVEQVINKRSMEANKDRVKDVRDEMWQLEKEGEIVVHRINDEHQPRIAKTIYGWDKKGAHHAAVAPQVLRPVRQHSGLPGIPAVADERNGHQVPG